MRRTRYQQGNLELAGAASACPNAWEYRWYEPQADGSRKRRSLVVGSLEQYPNEASAKRAVASLLVSNINAESPRFNLETVSVQTLVEHDREKESGKATRTKPSQRAKRTKVATPESGFCPAGGKPPVEGCQSGCRGGVAALLNLAERQQSKNSEHHDAVFNHAVRWEWHDRYPITHVRQSASEEYSDSVDASSGGGITSLSRRADAYRCACGRDDRIEGRRTAGAEVAGHRFREV